MPGTRKLKQSPQPALLDTHEYDTAHHLHGTVNDAKAASHAPSVAYTPHAAHVDGSCGLGTMAAHEVEEHSKHDGDVKPGDIIREHRDTSITLSHRSH